MSPEQEGFGMASNMFRPGRNYLSEPLSEFEINNFRMQHPELSIPSYESMMNANDELRNSNQNLDFGLSGNNTQSWDDLSYHPSIDESVEEAQRKLREYLDSPKEEPSKSKESSALGEVAEAFSILINPFKWFG